MSENGLHKVPAMRAALVAIQEQHKPVLTRFGSTVCPICDRLYPCPTRRLADQGLGDNLARTTKNGENND